MFGIFDASIFHALALVDYADDSKVKGVTAREGWELNRWGIVTTGNDWEQFLTVGVERILGLSGGGDMGRFAGVASTGLNATELHELPREEVERKMKEAVTDLLTRKGGKVSVVCLGCAAMVGLGDIVKETAKEIGYRPGELKVVDGVTAGVLMLEGLLKGGYNA